MIIKDIISYYKLYTKLHFLTPCYIYTAPLKEGGTQIEFTLQKYKFSLELYIYDGHNDIEYLLTDDQNYYEEGIIKNKKEFKKLFKNLHSKRKLS